MSRNNEQYIQHVLKQDLLFQGIFRALSDGIAVIDEGGIIRGWNEGNARLTGIEEAAALGQPLWEVQYKMMSTRSKGQANLDDMRKQIQLLLQMGNSPLLEEAWQTEVQHPNGKRRDISMRFLPVKTDEGFALAAVTCEIEKPRPKDLLNSLEVNALKAAANGIAITNNKGEFLWVNPAFTLLTGYTFEEIQGNTFRVLRSGQQNEEVYQDLWETVLRGNVWRGELVNRRKDSSLYIEEQIITPVHDEAGEVSHFIAIMQDATQRKITEEALQESERRFSEILETIKLVAIMLDMHGTIIYCNRFLLELAGWERNEVLGKHWFSTFLPPEIREQEEQRFRAGDIPSHYETQIVTRAGERRTIAWNNTFIHDAEGNRISTTSIGEDITERKKAETEIARLAAVVEQIEEGVLITDLNQKILYVNPYFENLTGYNKTTCLVKRITS
jgi:PAS domain S-box-containing protein